MKHLNKIVFIFCAVMLANPSFGQSSSKKVLPNKNIDVKREYDKDGNLIRYDSTYVYSWSSDSTHQMIPDSVFFKNFDMDEMHKIMKEHMNRFFDSDSSALHSFHHPFFSDDFLGDEFFDSDFFKKNFQWKDSSRTDFFNRLDDMMRKHQNYQFEHIDKMHNELDSLRKNFMQQRRKYLEKRDSIYSKHKSNKGKTVDI